MKHTLLIALVALLLASCASTNTGSSSYPSLYAQAHSQITIAKQMGFLWRDTELLLAKAQNAFDRGDKKKAMHLAREALEQAQLAQQQAREQSNPQVSYPNL